MLQSWTMPAPKIEGIAERGGVPMEMGRNPASFIEDAGYTSIVATNSEFEIERYPRLGDVISVTQAFEDDLRREEDLDGHRPFRHLVVDLHRPER